MHQFIGVFSNNNWPSTRTKHSKQILQMFSFFFEDSIKLTPSNCWQRLSDCLKKYFIMQLKHTIERILLTSSMVYSTLFVLLSDKKPQELRNKLKMKLVWSLLWVFFHTLALEHFWSNCFAGFCRLDIPIVSGKRHVVSDTHRHERWYHDTRWRHWCIVSHEYFQENYEKVLYLNELKMTGGKYVVLNLHSIFNVSIKRAITCHGREFLV